MPQRLWIPGPLPGLNEIIDAKATRYGRSGRSKYTGMKEKWDGLIRMLATAQNLRPFGEAHFVYLFRERSRRRDPSNFTAGARKVVEDALQQKGPEGKRIMPNDGWGNVLSFQDYWLVDAARPGVSVFITDERDSRAQEHWEKEDERCRS